MNVRNAISRMLYTEFIEGLKRQLFSSISVIAEHGAVQSGVFVTNIMSRIAVVSFASNKRKVDVGVVGSICIRRDLLELLVHNLE